MTQPSTIYEELSRLLQAHVSKIMVEATLRKAVADCHLEASELSVQTVPLVIEQAMISLRLFCDPDRLPDLMIALAEYCDRLPHQPRRESVSIRGPQSVRPGTLPPK